MVGKHVKIGGVGYCIWNWCNRNKKQTTTTGLFRVQLCIISNETAKRDNAHFSKNCMTRCIVNRMHIWHTSTGEYAGEPATKKCRAIERESWGEWVGEREVASKRKWHFGQTVGRLHAKSYQMENAFDKMFNFTETHTHTRCGVRATHQEKNTTPRSHIAHSQAAAAASDGFVCVLFRAHFTFLLFSFLFACVPSCVCELCCVSVINK